MSENEDIIDLVDGSVLEQIISISESTFKVFEAVFDSEFLNAADTTKLINTNTSSSNTNENININTIMHSLTNDASVNNDGLNKSDLFLKDIVGIFSARIDGDETTETENENENENENDQNENEQEPQNGAQNNRKKTQKTFLQLCQNAYTYFTNFATVLPTFSCRFRLFRMLCQFAHVTNTNIHITNTTNTAIDKTFMTMLDKETKELLHEADAVYREGNTTTSTVSNSDSNHNSTRVSKVMSKGMYTHHQTTSKHIYTYIYIDTIHTIFTKLIYQLHMYTYIYINTIHTIFTN